MFILDIKLLTLGLTLRASLLHLFKLVLQANDLICKLVFHYIESFVKTGLLPQRKGRPQPRILISCKPLFDVSHDIMIQIDINSMYIHVVFHRSLRRINSHLDKGAPKRLCLTQLILHNHLLEGAFKLNHTLSVLCHL